jgi:hypothetical protein
MKTKRLASVVVITVVLLSVSVLGTSAPIAAKQTISGKVFAPSATPTPPPFPKPPGPGHWTLSSIIAWLKQVFQWVKVFRAYWQSFEHALHLR